LHFAFVSLCVDRPDVMKPQFGIVLLLWFFPCLKQAMCQISEVLVQRFISLLDFGCSVDVCLVVSTGAIHRLETRLRNNLLHVEWDVTCY